VGTGLGLYLSRQLIQAHRGTIWAENMPDGGCKFSVTLPTVKSEALL
jgi:two-component system, NarL family, sensor kinase